MSTRKVVGLVIGVPVACLALGVGIYAAVAGSAHVRGQINAHNQQQSADNFIASNGQFWNDWESITARDSNVTTAAQAIHQFHVDNPNFQPNGTPYDPLAQTYGNLQTNLTGAEQQCNNAVATYNALAHQYLSETWRPGDLPHQITPSDQAFSAGTYSWAQADCVASPAEIGGTGLAG